MYYEHCYSERNPSQTEVVESAVNNSQQINSSKKELPNINNNLTNIVESTVTLIHNNQKDMFNADCLPDISDVIR